MAIIYFITFLFLIHIATSLKDEDELIVTLPYGKIKGHVLQSENDNSYYAFQEIPFAAPPVGDLRFKDPVAPDSWEGILETTKNTKLCHQDGLIADEGAIESEDCLYLNVYTPQNPSESAEDLLPVFVWIHGGGFTGGSGIYQQFGPKFIIDYDVIVVTVNYRLGAFGFITTGDGVITGNFGLKDQNFALQWVQENIKLFGGDPEKVTVAGESAGAFSASYQLISKKSEGLFRGVILQSGSALCPDAHQSFPRYIAFMLGQALDSNFTSEDSTDLLNLLKDAPAEDIAKASLSLPVDMDNGGPLWTPVIEPEDQDGAFITNPMHEDIKNGNINQVPLLFGFNSEEEIMFASFDINGLKQKGVYFDEDLSRVARLTFNMTKENENTVGSELRKIYTDGDFQDDFGGLVRYMSDFRFTTPISRHAELQSQYTDVYLYQLSYKGELPGVNVTLEGVDPNGVAHGEDIAYIWENNGNSDSSKYPEEDLLTRKRILTLWTNFVKYLNPTPEEDDVLQNVIWPKVSSDQLSYLNINSTLEVKTDPKQYKKWKEIVDTYAIPPLISY